VKGMEGPFQYLNNRRRHVRVPYPCELEYCLESPPSEKIKAYTINISSGGLCLYLPCKLSVGQEITLDSNILPFLCETARVCWIKETGDNHYMAGLEFLPAE
jgi:c-di-GMP-binding flagellar brake protein YcgR